MVSVTLKPYARHYHLRKCREHGFELGKRPPFYNHCEWPLQRRQPAWIPPRVAQDRRPGPDFFLRYHEPDPQVGLSDHNPCIRATADLCASLLPQRVYRAHFGYSDVYSTQQSRLYHFGPVCLLLLGRFGDGCCRPVPSMTPPRQGVMAEALGARFSEKTLLDTT